MKMRGDIMVSVFRMTLVLATLFGSAFTWAESAPDSSIEPDVQSEAKPWTSLNLNNDPNVFRFGIVTDNTGGPRAGIFGEAVAKLNLLQPEFVMSIGDFIEGYEDTREQIDAQWDGFMIDIAKFEMPFLFVPGNHDNGRPLWSEVYRKRFGAEYYHFVYKNVLFLCLSTNDGPDNNTGIGQEQIDYISRVLSRRSDVRWTLVFQHKPLWNDQGNADWAKVADLLKGRKCTVFAGHTHNYLSQEKDGISFITLATTGGGSKLRGPAFGQFDEIAWVSMTEEGPRVANLLLDGILDKDLRTPEMIRNMGSFQTGGAITTTPILSKSPQFESGVTTVKIENPCDEPVRVKVLSETQKGVRVEPGTISTVIPAHGQQVTEQKITADPPIPASEVQPVVLHWKAGFDRHNNTPSKEIGGKVRIFIESPFDLPRRDTKPAIDGKLDDWAELPFNVDQPGEVWHNEEGWKGPQDGAFRFAVAYDDQYLYVALKATDDEPTFDGWKYWEDFAVLWVDGGPPGDKDPRKSIFNVIVGPQMSPEQKEEFAVGKAPEGTLAASQATSDGLAAEFAIPIAALNEAQGGSWQSVRLNVGFSDFDRGDARDGVTFLYWRPMWTGRGGDPESGTFQKSKGKS
jgi:hypothetical protein